MQRHPFLFVAILTAALFSGCDRATPSTQATGPTTQAAATAPAATQPTASVLTINGKAYEFRPARLVVDAKDDGVLVQVFSEGASPEGEEDGYYLEMTLADVADASQIDGASWQYTSQSNDRNDEMLSAITVNGGGNQLQPKDVTATFHEVSPDTVEVRIHGFFNVFAGRGGATGSVPVEATLLARRQGP